jgi:GTP-binding protein
MDAVFVTSAYRRSQYPPPDKPEIAFAGRSNVGKSSLINALVNRRGLAKISSRPGRTRSINFLRVDDRLFLVDLPGYGFASAPLNVRRSWHRLVEGYLRDRPNLKGTVVILDIRREPTSLDIDLMGWLSYFGIQAIVVLTKADKLSRQQASLRTKRIAEQLSDLICDKPITFSAKTKQGRDEIWKKIYRLIEP